MGICEISAAGASDIDDVASDACGDVENQPIAEADSADNHQQANDENSLGTVHRLDGKNNTFADLKNTFDQAVDGDTIELNGTFSFSETVNVQKSIKITGCADGATINMGLAVGSFTYFNIDSTASKVVLSNLKFTGSTASAVSWNGDDGLIENCIFQGNYAQGAGLGGAINMKANNCNITGCTFKNNRAYNNGGAVYIEGENILISNSKFESNQVNNNDLTITAGGAVYVEGEYNIIQNSSFLNNYISNTINSTSLIGGGAVYSNSDGLTVNKSTFKKNNAPGLYGGAVSSNEPYTIMNSLFESNIAFMGNDISGNIYSIVMNNHFILEYDENDTDAIYGINRIYFDENNFTINKVASSVKFSAGMVLNMPQQVRFM